MLAERLRVSDPEHVITAADFIVRGDIIILAFNGVFALVCDIDNENSAKDIFKVKSRPLDRGLAIVCPPPQYIDEFIDLCCVDLHHLRLIKQFYGSVHAVGALLPADKSNTPNYLVKNDAVLNIWTEYPPLCQLMDHLRSKKVRALVGTSANKSGYPTHNDPELVFEEFKHDVPCMLLDDFRHLPLQRRKSTSIVDFTVHPPRLFREGSLTADEIRQSLRNLGLGDLAVDDDVKKVTGFGETNLKRE